MNGEQFNMPQYISNGNNIIWELFLYLGDDNEQQHEITNDDVAEAKEIIKSFSENTNNDGTSKKKEDECKKYFIKLPTK